MRIRGWWCEKDGQPSSFVDPIPWDASLHMGWRGNSEEDWIEFINKKFPDLNALSLPVLLWYIDEEL